MFGSSVSSTAVITTAAGSTRILCATIHPYSLPTTTHHFSSHLLPTTSVGILLHIFLLDFDFILVQWYWF
jgi:hypothetical protein